MKGYFTGRVVCADEALQMGMVNCIVPSARLSGAAREWAEELASLSTIAAGYMKRTLHTGLRASLSDVLDAEAIHMIRTIETQHHKGAARTPARF